MTPAIACQGLSKRYGGVLAVDSLDLEIPAGEVFGFLGPNGAGKTTTIGMLVGIGFLQQEPAIYGWMRGREFLDFIGRAHGLNAGLRRDRATDLLQRFSLPAYFDFIAGLLAAG